MNRTLSGVLGALVLGGAVLGSVVISKPAEAARRIYERPGMYSRYRTSRYRHYRHGRWYSTYSVPRRGKYGDLDRDGIRNKWDRDRDGDGRRNKRDDHPSNRHRR
jgi:hypothetical protein